MNNQFIRDHAKRSGVKLWEIAYALNIADSNFSRKLRLELPDAERERILAIIDEISLRKRSKTA